MRLAAASLLAAVALVGCKKQSAIEQVQNEFAGPEGVEPIQLSASVEKREVALGDDVLFHFKLTNSGKSRVTVNVPRLDQRSVSFRVRRADGSVATVTRNHSDIDRRSGQLRPQPGETKELGPGESLEQDVSTVAVQTGKIAYTPSYAYQGAMTPLVGQTTEVAVTPADPQKPRLGVVLETSEGSYTGVFRPDVAYNTVESFASLAKRGFYSGLTFHRIIGNFMAQGGDPEGTGGGGPGYFLPLEAAKPPKLPHRRGVMSMARTENPDTAGSQFFIMFGTNPNLDRDGYTTFAEMIDGEETLKKLQQVKTAPGDKPLTPVVIQRASLVSVP